MVSSEDDASHALDGGTGQCHNFAMRNVNAVATLVLFGLALVAWTLGIIRAWQFWSIPPAFLSVSITLTACACLGWVLLTVSDTRRDGECRCRKCSHILRGLSEPRCPECGERI